ncbi:MAG: DoxX family protein [Planctomycetes bacterium]|nr:DoxX family protein [Planctomycetota bacterium]
MRQFKVVSRYVLAIFMVGAGTMHFVKPEFYVKIMPPYLPWHQELVYLSGFGEMALGALLLVPRFSRLAAWGIFALLIAVFPANIYVYQHQEVLPAPPWLHVLRFPLQGVFLLWAYWHTRPSIGVEKRDAT